jgi:RimJ/RimL family protein N-acetyltransferase
MDNSPQIETERLVLRALTRDELILMHGGNLGVFRRAKGWPSSHLIEALPHFINDLLDDPALVGWNVWVVILKEFDIIIGDVGLKGPPDENGIVEVGYSMSIPFRGKGYMAEAVSALIKWAVSDCRVKSVIAECEDSNEISKRVLRSVGMEMMGKKGKATYWKLRK